MRTLRSILLVILAISTVGLAHGQVASVLFVEDEPLPNAPDFTATTINTPDVNGAKGWSFSITASETGGLTTSLAYGTYDGSEAPAVLRTESTNADYRQDSWESFFGMADADVCYSASCTRLSDNEDGLDSVWVGDTLVAIEEEPYPHLDGWFWRFGSRPGTTRDGVPYFVGGITDTQGGSTQVRGLFYGLDGAPIVIGGMAIDGLPDPVITNTAAVSFDFRFSAYGTHYVAEVNTDTGTTTDDSHVVIDGAVAMAGGLPMSEAGMVPESIGGLPGEVWDNWDYLGINEAGRWMVTGDTAGDTSQDEFLVVDGLIMLREGDTIDGMTLSGGIERAYLGEDGDWACVWDVEFGAETAEALILNGEIILMQGMAVDFDGDGIPDDGYVVNDFSGTGALVVAERDELGRLRLVFTADVEAPDAARQPVGPVQLAAEEDGLDEDVVEQPADRAELEMALMYITEATVSLEDEDEPGDLPARELALAQNYPNPFNPVTRIDFNLARSEAVSLVVYDLQGRAVRTLVQGEMAAGPHHAVWDGTGDHGRRVASGTYMYRLETGDRLLTRTMVMVK